MIDVKSFLVGLGTLIAYGSLYFSFSLTARRPVFRREGGDVAVSGHRR